MTPTGKIYFSAKLEDFTAQIPVELGIEVPSLNLSRLYAHGGR